MENITVKEILEATGGCLLCGSEGVSLSHISIDSRTMKGQDLFVPLVGKKVDAHNFVDQAIQNGAVAVLTSEHDTAKKEWIEEAVCMIRVQDTKKALQAVGSFYRNRLILPLVGITGSVGKTTTREMVALALSAGFRTFKTPGNSNSQVGLPITLTEISDEDEIGVIELGMSEPGELTVIARIARLNTALITNIGIAHIEQLGSQENIRREKMTILDGLMSGGLLLLNGDDEILKNAVVPEEIRVIYYGTGENSSYRAEDISLSGGLPVFTAVHGETRIPVRLGVMGLHNVQNAMAALAVAGEYGVSLMDAAARLEEFTGFSHRQQVFLRNGITIIDDTYNASPASMKAVLEVLMSMECRGRKIAVLADMLELGDEAKKAHYEIGELIGASASCVDQVVLLGGLAKEIGGGIYSRSSQVTIVEFMDQISLAEYLKKELQEGDCVLFKGSNGMKLAEAVQMYQDSLRA